MKMRKIIIEKLTLDNIDFEFFSNKIKECTNNFLEELNTDNETLKYELVNVRSELEALKKY